MVGSLAWQQARPDRPSLTSSPFGVSVELVEDVEAGFDGLLGFERGWTRSSLPEAGTPLENLKAFGIARKTGGIGQGQSSGAPAGPRETGPVIKIAVATCQL
jgi:hypothetical protein